MIVIPFVAFDAVIIAIMALLLLFATIYFFRWIAAGMAHPLGGLPAPFNRLAGALVSGAEGMAAAALGALGGWAQQALSPFQSFLDYLGQTLPALHLQSQVVWDSALGFAQGLYEHTFPQAYRDLSGYAQQLYALATQWAAGEIDALITSVNGGLATLQNRIDANAQADAQALEGVASALADYINQTGAAVADGVVSTADDALSYASAAGAWAVDYAEAVTLETRAWFDAQMRASYDTLATAIVAVENWTADSVNTVAGVLYDDIVAIEKHITDVVDVAIEAEQTWRNDCGDPLCQGLLDFSRALQLMQGLVTGGVIMALVADAVRDPRGTAEAVNSVASGPIAAQFASVRQAVGV